MSQVRPQTYSADVLDRNLAAILQQEVDLGADALVRGKPELAITCFQSALNKTDASFPLHDHLIHNLLLAYKGRIEALLADGNEVEADELLERALQLAPAGVMLNDSEFLRHFVEAFNSLGLTLFQNYKPHQSIQCFRRALSISPSVTDKVNLINSLAVVRERASLSDFAPQLDPGELGNHIFVACAPKSGSTFLKNALVDLTGYRDLFSVFAAGQNEHDLYLPALIQFADRNTVTQQHCRASEANVQLMQAFGIRPIILVRNIFDSVVSMRDFYRNGAWLNSYFRADFPLLDAETQIDLLIDNFVPWYLQFVASWHLAAKEARVEMMWLTYEELTSDNLAAISRVLEFYGLGASTRNMTRSLKMTLAPGRRNRFNKGVVGRGRTILTKIQQDRISAQTRYFPSTDFGQIGL